MDKVLYTRLSTGTLEEKMEENSQGLGWGGAMFPDVNKGNSVGPQYIVDSP